ncbi:MAG: dipicolinate synthase subunit DpsA [Clostridia bacterium]|jgi:S-adenosyl-L-homocysteine hydrolase, NAD binding domain|nr:dipicolinate synthase subunit DpsA [Clostridium sp.]MEE0127485.1 dipicolinate synthase subunit DpsA [Clostridia bacterium]HJJ13151.1 dipicolinate synthase subunit DpsA [Clostridiaceae bacterium]
MKNISIIGGDLRIVKLVDMLNADGYNVYTYGLEQANIDDIQKCKSIEEVSEKSDIIVSSIPFTSDGVNVNTPFSKNKISIEEVAKYIKGKTFIAGRIEEELYQKFSETKVIDLLKREELTVLNTIATAEGTIQIAMEESTKTLHGSKILVMGFGRVSKILSNMLKGIGAEVYCETRTTVNCAWIKAYGYNPILLDELDEELNKFDVIINTIPHIILNKERLKKVKKDCIIIDIASNPGGVDRNSAKELGIKMIWALSLPGRVAPITSAEFIKETLENIIKDLKNN